MRKNIYKSQIGSISMYVMMAMAFFLATIVGVYMISAKRSQTQTESLSIVRGKYYTEGEENERYSAKMPAFNEFIPIYTKEQLWSIGENKYVEIEGKVYEFNTTDLSKYELKNDIIINIETDLANSKFKDNFLYGDNTINKNNFEVFYYYNGNYYVPVQYSDGTTITNLSDGTAVLSASGNNFSNISTVTTGLSGKYYLFAYANLSGDLGYVTDGLMLHYDGIKNTATGHKSDATTWKDLSGNGNDGTLNGCTWEDDSVKLDNNSSGIIGDYKDTLKLTEFTIDIILKSYNSISNSAVLYDFHTTGQNGFFSKISNSYIIVACGNTRYNYNYDFFNSNYPLKLTVKCSKTNSELNIFINDKSVYKYTENIDIDKSTNLLFGILNNDSCNEGAYLGNLNSFKLYNRALTDFEIKQNYAIDKARFGIE